MENNVFVVVSLTGDENDANFCQAAPSSVLTSVLISSVRIRMEDHLDLVSMAPK